MESVIKALKYKQNALLESPTGTGKTMSLLCSSLAWQQSQSKSHGLIYYTSRTHVQLSQAAKEMKRTAYAKVPAVVLASRERMCLNDEVLEQSLKQNSAINRACRNAIARGACTYHRNYETKMKKMDINNVYDIEDLFTYGRENECCPYYASKKLAESKASIVFLPYNYLLDLSINLSSQLRLENSILIFDEGHNLEAALKDSASGQFTQKYLETLLDSCKQLPSKLSDVLNSEVHGLTRRGFNPRNTGIVDEFANPNKKKKSSDDERGDNGVSWKFFIEELASYLTTERLNNVCKMAVYLSDCKQLLETREGRFLDTKCDIENILTILQKACVDYVSSTELLETMEKMCTFWSVAGVMRPITVANYLAAITSVSQFIELLFPKKGVSPTCFGKNMDMIKDSYVSYMKCELTTDLVPKLINWEMNLWCLNPAIGIKRVFDNCCIEGPRSIIITSGTLAPLRLLETELNLPFLIQKEFNHLINEQQFKVMIIGQSPTEYPLTSTYNDTKNPRYSEALGKTLLPLFKMLPFGTLLFFSSYSLMNKVIQDWKSRFPSIWTDLNDATRIFIESKDRKIFERDMDSFRREINQNRRAVYLSVCRGKLSEGTNLDGNQCRSVIVVGLPFPSLKEAKVKETRLFQAKHRDDKDGDQWYTNQMRRALCQAFGRVIRSKLDFGMLILCDPRFTRYSYGLSTWINRFYPREATNDYKRIPGEIKEFFAQHDVDVELITIAQSNGDTVNSVFELDQTTRVIDGPDDSSGSKQLANTGSLKEIATKVNVPTMQNELATKNRQETPLNRWKAINLLRPTIDISGQNMARKLNSARQPGVGPTEPKRPKTTVQAFDDIFLQSNDAIGVTPIEPTPPVALAKQIDQSRICYICMRKAFKPHVINCSCARLGCFDCLKVLHQKPCGVCGMTLKKNQFKEKLFSSNPFQKKKS